MRRIVLASLFVLVGCRETKSVEPAPPEPSVEAPATDPVARARTTVTTLKQELKQALMKAVANDGAVGAIEVCRLKAPALAAGASNSEVRVGRSALKLRNEKNAPADWLRPVMERLSKVAKTDAKPEVVELEGGAVGYVEPIYTGGICLTCHGVSLAPEVTAAIDAAYPNDAARGFAPDEFRGVFWAVVAPNAK